MLIIFTWAICFTSFVPVTYGQVDEIGLSFGGDDIGWKGTTRPGSWTPLRLTLENRSAQPRQVRCRWVVPDADADRAQLERTITLTPNRSQTVWLYAPITYRTTTSTNWQVQVIDETTGRTIDRTFRPPSILSSTTAMIGSTSASHLGLAAYVRDTFQNQRGYGKSNWTQHEEVDLIRGLSPDTLPDRWQGYGAMETFIWTPDAIGPDTVLPQILRAIRQWVQRGGHLVVVLPTEGDSWTTSALGPLLPPVTMTTVSEAPAPYWLTGGLFLDDLKVGMKVFTLDPSDHETSVLLRDVEDRPVVVARQAGFGRVTLVGVNLTNPALIAAGHPSGKMLWNTIFNWHGQAWMPSIITDKLEKDEIVRPDFRDDVELGLFARGQTNMRESASTAVLLSMILFIAYWLAAGPGSFAWLKSRQTTHHSWAAFTVVVALFSVVTWSSAYVLRPTKEQIRHVSVVDFDAVTGDAHVTSWASIFVPRHGIAQVRVDPGATETTSNTLASVGVVSNFGGDEGGYTDTQRYELSATTPAQIAVPVRATPRRMTLDYLGPLASRPEGLSADWRPPNGEVKVTTAGDGLEGVLVHRLPDALHDVIVVYCPGDGQMPVVWPLGPATTWAPGQALNLETLTNAKPMPLIIEPRTARTDRGDRAKWGGFLGFLTERGEAFGQQPDGTPVPDMTYKRPDEVTRAIEMLSFFGTLPPPNYLTSGLLRGGRNYTRALGRAYDLSHLLPLRRVIIMGHLPESPLPVPMTVDGDILPAQGWTTIRWITPLTPNPSLNDSMTQ